MKIMIKSAQRCIEVGMMTLLVVGAKSMTDIKKSGKRRGITASLTEGKFKLQQNSPNLSN